MTTIREVLTAKVQYKHRCLGLLDLTQSDVDRIVTQVLCQHEYKGLLPSYDGLRQYWKCLKCLAIDT